MAYTRVASPLYVWSAYLTICTMACVSPPPSWVSDFVVPTSQQFWLVASGKIRTNPALSAPAWMPLMLFLYPSTGVPHEWCATRIGGLVAKLSGT
jgi:hypothetical protein